MQLKDLIDNLQQYCKSSNTIQRFHFDFKDQINVFAKENDTFPMVFVSPVTNMNISNKNGFSGTSFIMDLFVLDKINNDRTNIITIMNETNNIINDITNHMKGIKGIEMNEFSPITPYNDYTVSMLAGHSLTIELLISMNVDCVDAVDIHNNILILNTIDDILVNVILETGQDLTYVVPNSNLHVTVKNQNDVIFNESDVSVVAGVDDSLDISIITTNNPTINIKNSDDTYDINTTLDVIIPDTGHDIIIKNTDDVIVDNVPFILPSSVNYIDDIIIDDTIVDVYVNGVLQDTVNIKYGDTTTITFQ